MKKRGVLISLVFFLLLVTFVSAQSITHNGKEYYKVTSTDANMDTGNEVCASVGKTCVGFTESTDAVCKKFNPSAASTTSSSGDGSGVYCDGAPQGGICGTKSNTCHTCPACTKGVDCGTPIGGLYREMYVECASGKTTTGQSDCPVKSNSKTTKDFLNEISSLNSRLSKCPTTLPKGASGLVGSGIIRVDIKMTDGSTESFFLVKKDKQITEIRDNAAFYNYLVTTDEDSVDLILQSNNRFGTFSALYATKKIRISGKGFLAKFRLFFTKPILSIVTKRNQIPITRNTAPVRGTTPSSTITQTTTVTIGPYPNMWACEFYQIPFPGVNKKHVSCPYETPGAAINEAHHAFCRTAMSSQAARAEVCNEQGLIVCVHPCETTPQHIIPTRCAFDISRQRGNQAPPFNWCAPRQPPSVPSGAGRPSNCDDTAYQAHPGYNANRALWDRYASETDGVCQTRERTGTPQGGNCRYTIQQSRGTLPYYICFYDN